MSLNERLPHPCACGDPDIGVLAQKKEGGDAGGGGGGERDGTMLGIRAAKHPVGDWGGEGRCAE